MQLYRNLYLTIIVHVVPPRPLPRVLCGGVRLRDLVHLTQNSLGTPIRSRPSTVAKASRTHLPPFAAPPNPGRSVREGLVVVVVIVAEVELGR